jgi:hypothetical protein
MAKNVKPSAKAAAAEQPDPSVKSLAYLEMESKWAMIITLMGGTDAMRMAERTYLPQHAEESNENYNERLNRNTLFNMFELTLDSLVGKPFVEPIKLNSDVPEEIANEDTGYWKNIDLQGASLTSFAREWLRDAIAKGFSHILIDMPKLDPAEKATRTLEDDLKENRRPYWTLIRPENMLFAYAIVKNGVEVLQHVRIAEVETVMDGFREVTKQRIRILEPGRWELWELRKTDEQKDPIWVKIEEGLSDLDYIPLVTFYANRSGFMTSKPPLEDLAHLNVRHWQSTSDQINILTVARFPMLAVSGAQMVQGSQENMAIGPRQLLATRDANGKFYYVEHTGKAIGAGETDLEKLEDKMASWGAEFLRRKIGGRTATERALDSSEAISPLKDMSLRFMVSVNQALKITADWINKSDGGTCLINTDFTEEDANTAAINTLTEARKRGDISRWTWLEEMKRLEVLAADLDTEEEMDQIEWEATNLIVKPSFVTASEQIRSVETVNNADDSTATDILNDVPGGGDDNTDNPAGGNTPAKAPSTSKPAAKSKPGTSPKGVKKKKVPVDINHPVKGKAKLIGS